MDGGFREWLSGLTRRELVLLGLLGAGALAGAGLWYVRSLPQPVRVRAAPVAAPTATATAPATVFVHVAGHVAKPGVYELSDGARIIDAVEAAGGARGGADLSLLNLAAALVDGQQVLVPKGGAPGTEPAAPAAGGEAAATVINLNTATSEELEVLPGIGEVLSGAIVAYREEHGPFTSVDQLDEVSGIGEVTLEEIRDLVTV